MKTNTIIAPVFLLLFSSYDSLVHAQQNFSSENNPHNRYDVQRQYDENGNLIYYDSVAVYTWGYDSTETDSLNNSWEYGEPNQNRPFYYGYRYPGDNFGILPPFEFDFVIPDLHDFNDGFEYGFSFEPFDSLYSPIFPDDSLYFHQYIIPPFDLNMDIEEQFYRMHQYMQEMQERMMQEFWKPDWDPYEPSPLPEDSIESPDLNPSPFPNSYKRNTIYL